MDYETQKYLQQQQINKDLGIPVGNDTSPDEEDTNRWEIESDSIIDVYCRGLMGEVPDEQGKWVRDHNKQRRMNEKGMGAIKSELQIINKHLFLSEIDVKAINRICLEAGSNLSDVFTENYQDFEMKPDISELKSITDQVVNRLFIALMSAVNGGMRTHRERAKHPFMPNMMQGGVM